MTQAVLTAPLEPQQGVTLRQREYQQAAIDELRDGFAQGYRRQMLCAPTGAGKCLAAGTTVLTWNGRIIDVREVYQGLQLMGPDGRPRTVQSTSRGYGQLYRIIPTKGESWICNDVHVLSLVRTNDGWGKANDVVDVPLNQWHTWSRTQKHIHKLYRVGVPFSSKELRIHPYLLGALLGDGSLTRGRILLTSTDVEVVESVSWLALQYGVVCKPTPSAGRAQSYLLSAPRGKANLLLEALRVEGVMECRSGDKFIPDDYKTGDEQQRLQLLAGLMDTDGHLSKGYYDYLSKSIAMAVDIAYVARSLGFAAYVSRKRSAEGVYWRVSISGDVDRIPCRIPRKRAAPRRQPKDVLRTGFRVEDAGHGEYYGFTLDGDGRFLLGDFTVTHNTEMAIALMEATRRNGRKVAFVAANISLVWQTADRLRKYGIPHGMWQASNRYGAHEAIQVLSAQTLQRRETYPDIDLLIIDEAHEVREALLTFAKGWGGRIIGLSATPLTPGLGEHYDRVVNATTTQDLLEAGWLAPLRFYEGRRIQPKPVSGREWTADEVRTASKGIYGDIVREWVEKTALHFGGPVPTLLFSADIAHGREIARRFQEAGYDFRQGYAGQDDRQARELIEGFRAGAYTGLISVMKFCLDAETEILTSDGWTGIDAMRDDSLVANWWPHGAVTFTRPDEVIRRSVAPGEYFVRHSDRLRVTQNHRMIVKHPGWAWQWRTAEELLGKRRMLPINGHAAPFPIEAPQSPAPAASDPARRISANSYHLRKKGMDYDDARVEAAARIAERDALARKAPSELSLDECTFIGFWLGDGSKASVSGGITYSLSQSQAYPDNIRWIDGLLTRLGYDYARREVQPHHSWVANSSPAVLWNIGRGTGFGSQRRRGLFAIEPYLEKNGSDLWWGMDEAQFAALIEGFWRADGNHDDTGHIHIGNTRYELLSLLQAIAVCRGWRAMLRKSGKPQKNHHAQCYILVLKRGVEAVQLNGFQAETAVDGERVWCVSVPSSAIITRRGGRVLVVGNCKGFDVEEVKCLVDARPNTQSLSAVIQKIGRGMRTISHDCGTALPPGARSCPGCGTAVTAKDECIYIGHGGNIDRWYDDIEQVWMNGVSELLPKREKREGNPDHEPRPDIVCACGMILPPLTRECPYCGRARKPRRTKARERAGHMVELVAPGSRKWLENKAWTWQQLCLLGMERRGGDPETARKWASGQFKSCYGYWPSAALDAPDGVEIDERVRRKVRSNIRTWLKSRRG